MFEAMLAVATLTLWPILDERSQGTASQRSRAMVYFPVVGFALGVILAIADRAASIVFGPAGRSFIVMIAGAALSLSPFLVLFAVFFWAFLWGIPGAFIGVPIVIACLTLCEQRESTRWIAMLLSGREGR